MFYFTLNNFPFWSIFWAPQKTTYVFNRISLASGEMVLLNFGPFLGPFLGTVVENAKHKKVAPDNFFN